MHDWHPQDHLLIAEALILDARDGDAPRDHRAWHLADALLAAAGVPPGEAHRQIDGDCPHSRTPRGPAVASQ